MPNKQSTTFILFRHGETNTNNARIMQGNTNNGVFLTDKGQQQAKELGQNLRNRFESIDFMLSSGMDRVNTTLSIVGESFGIPEENVYLLPDLMGVNKGSMTGVGYKEFIAFLQSNNSDVVRADQIATEESLRRFMNVTYPEGESRGLGGVRALNSLISFYNKNQENVAEKNIAVCMHSSTMAVVKAILGLCPLVGNTEMIDFNSSELFEIHERAQSLLSV